MIQVQSTYRTKLHQQRASLSHHFYTYTFFPLLRSPSSFRNGNTSSFFFATCKTPPKISSLFLMGYFFFGGENCLKFINISLVIFIKITYYLIRKSLKSLLILHTYLYIKKVTRNIISK